MGSGGRGSETSSSSNIIPEILSIYSNTKLGSKDAVTMCLKPTISYANIPL